MASLAGVKPGDTIYCGRAHDTLLPKKVKAVGKLHVTTEDGMRYRIGNGWAAGEARGPWHTFAVLETPGIKAKAERRLAQETFERELAQFRAAPRTAEEYVRVIRAMNPEAWR